MPGARVHVTGIVQGVGFRPFVWTLAHRYALTGWVQNSSSGVDIALDFVGVVIQEPAKDAGGEMPIAELVKTHTGGKSWDEDTKTSCAMQNGLLVVKQTPEVHAQVARLLNLLRRHK